MVGLTLLLLACSSPSGSEQSTQVATKYPEGCMIGTDRDGETEICTFANLPPCPDTGPPDLASGAYPCVGGNWGGRGMYWQGCESQEPSLRRAIDRRDEILSEHRPGTAAAEEAARDLAVVVTTVHLLGCDETVDALLDK